LTIKYISYFLFLKFRNLPSDERKIFAIGEKVGILFFI